MNTNASLGLHTLRTTLTLRQSLPLEDTQYSSQLTYLVNGSITRSILQKEIPVGSHALNPYPGCRLRNGSSYTFLHTSVECLLCENTITKNEIKGSRQGEYKSFPYMKYLYPKYFRGILFFVLDFGISA